MTFVVLGVCRKTVTRLNRTAARTKDYHIPSRVWLAPRSLQQPVMPALATSSYYKRSLNFNSGKIVLQTLACHLLHLLSFPVKLLFFSQHLISQCDQKAHEKMLSITIYQRSINQSYRKVSLNVSQNGQHPKIYKQQMLQKVWGERNNPTPGRMYTQRKLEFKKIHAPPCSQHCYLQQQADRGLTHTHYCI